MLIGDGLIIDYPIVDADAHVNEPPDLWQERVPASLRGRAPKVTKREDGADTWQFEGGKRVRYVGLSAIAGLSYVQYRSHGLSYDQIRPSSFDPAARLRDMDLDGIHAAVLYPSVTLAGAESYSTDAELQVACVRAYNDWLAEFCAHAPDRLHGLGVIPTVGIEAAVAELERCLSLGHKGVIISRYPNGGFDPQDEDDAFWARATEADVP